MIEPRKVLKKLKGYVPGKPIEEVKRELGLTDVCKLASNENPFAPDYIRQAVLKEIENINRYPESGCFYLRRALAERLKVKPEQIIFGNGSDEIITLVLRAFVGPGDQVVVAYPTFLIYEIQSAIQEAKIRTVPLRANRYDLESMMSAVTKKTKIVFIANPDNPSGTYLTHKQVVRFLNKVPRNVLVFLDEAYFEFAPTDFPDSIKLLKKYDNLIFTRTFSKAYGLAGLRIGYGVANSCIINSMNKVREPFNVNRFSQVAAVEALKQKKYLQKVLSYTNQEKKYFYNEFKKLGIRFIESATNFVLVDLGSDVSDFEQFMLENGIIIRTLKGWGLNNFFRVTVGLKSENKKFVTVFKKYIKQFFK